MPRERRSLWNPAPDWHEHDPFPGVKTLVDPKVTPAQIRKAMEEDDDQSRPFRTEVRPEHLNQILD